MADPAGADRDGRTRLHYAAAEGSRHEVERLIALGLDVNVADRRGYTPLHFAAGENHVEAAIALLDAGASVDARDAYGNTALWTATFNSRGRGELIRLLLARGADPDSANAAGATPRELASRIANYDVAKFFDGADSA